MEKKRIEKILIKEARSPEVTDDEEPTQRKVLAKRNTPKKPEESDKDNKPLITFQTATPDSIPTTYAEVSK